MNTAGQSLTRQVSNDEKSFTCKPSKEEQASPDWLSKGKQLPTKRLPKGKPRGFRDILFAEAERRERLTADINAYFFKAGYQLVETPSVEYPETLALEQKIGQGINQEANQEVAQKQAQRDTFRFVDIDGNLIALRSDVTGALARIVATRFSLVKPPYRLRYVADVFQEQESLRGSDRQLTQIGLECYGLDASKSDIEVLMAALGAAASVGIEQVKLHMSDISLMNSLAQEALQSGNQRYDQFWQKEVYTAWREGDLIRVRELATPAMSKLLDLRGGLEVLDEAAHLCAGKDEAISAIENLRNSFRAVQDFFDKQELAIDFSLAPRLEYYTGLIFELNARCANGRSNWIGCGGRYDNLLANFGRDLPAVGFVYDLASLEKIVASFEEDTNKSSLRPPLRIAIPKGKLYVDSVELLMRVGVNMPELADPGRTLRFSNKDYDIIIAKPTDVAIYVSRGAADIGIGGRDTLVEADFPLLQLIDLRFGGCDFVIAGPNDNDMNLDELSLALGTIRVASKYPRLTQQFFDNRGIQVEIVKLNGNIELAPLIGIADLVVDLTQTGTTLRENNLRVVETVLPSTARFVAQHSAARSDSRVAELVSKIEKVIAGDLATAEKGK